jgi:hypothetical protein
MKILVALILIVGAPCYAVAQTIQIDRVRDLALHAIVRGFLDGTVPADQLDIDLREYARAFEANPYKVETANIDWEKVPQERMFAFVRATSLITQPSLEAFFKGELSASQAALKIAPFFLMWPGYGIDPPGTDLVSQQRTDEVLARIHEYAATMDDLRFGHVAEGYTSRDEATGANVAPRMFSAPDNICANAPRPAALHVPPDRIELEVGKAYPINRLVIVGRDEAGAVLRDVPIAIEVEIVEPPLLNRQSDAMPENHLHPVRSGVVRIRVRTICTDPSVQAFMHAVIK